MLFLLPRDVPVARGAPSTLPSHPLCFVGMVALGTDCELSAIFLDIRKKNINVDMLRSVTHKILMLFLSHMYICKYLCFRLFGFNIH